MKPRTKLQKKITAASARLKPATPEHINWAVQKLFDHYYVRHRKTYYCLECGGKFKTDPGLQVDILGADCPHCGLNLKPLHQYNGHGRLVEYWSIIDKIDDYQVVRIFVMDKWMKKHRKSEIINQEVMQHFIDEKGKHHTLMGKTRGFSGYFDSWISGEPLEFRSYTGSFFHRQRIHPYCVYPKRKVQRIYKRNGYKTSFYGIHPAEFFSLLISEDRFEKLLKMKQYKVMERFKVRRDNVDTYWNQIVIATRHGYYIDNPSDWFDYLGLLAHFGKDINNPHYICCEHLHREHQRYVEKRRLQRERERIAELRKTIIEDDKIYQQQKARFFDLQIKAGKLEIVPLKSVQEFVDIGDKLKHCLFSNEYHKKEKSLIMVAKLQDEPIETIEISFVDFKVAQSRGYNNKATPYHDKIVKAVNRQSKKIAKQLQL